MPIRCHRCGEPRCPRELIVDKHDRFYCHECWAFRNGLIPPSLPLAEMPPGFVARAGFTKWAIRQGRLSDELGAGESVDEVRVAEVCAGRGT